MSSILKKLKKENSNYVNYSTLSKEELEKYKNRALEIKNEIDLLSKKKFTNLEDFKKLKRLTDEFIQIKKVLDKYLKYTQIRENRKENDNIC